MNPRGKIHGGVDLLDACVARYKYHMRSWRWYLYLFWQTIMLGLVNAWLIYCCDCKLLGVQKRLPQAWFLWVHKWVLQVCVGVPADVCTDQVAHWPVKCDQHGCCKLCKVHATTTLCEKCNVRICFTEGRNCFKSYHLAQAKLPQMLTDARTDNNGLNMVLINLCSIKKEFIHRRLLVL